MKPCDPARLKEIVCWLADEIGPRPKTKPDLLNMVAEQIEGLFIQLGYHVEMQPVTWGRTTYYNVIAMPPGETTAQAICPLLVVGAHYDTVSTTPGADDNASAIAGLIELARILTHRPPPGIRLAAFCPEEPPAFRTRRMGSYVMANSLRKENAQLQGMICLEMIGYFRDQDGSQSYPFPLMNRIYPRRGNFIAIVGNLRSRSWTKAVKEGFEKGSPLPIARLNAPFFVYGIDFSDHWSFSKHGYPAAMVTDTAFYRNPHYHKPTDRPDTLDYCRAAQVIDGVAAAVTRLSLQKR